MKRGRRISLVARFGLAAIALVTAGIAATLVLVEWVGSPWIAALLAWLLVAPAVLFTVRALLQPLLSMFRALAGTVLSYQDGDYAFGLNWRRNDEMADLVDAHNDLGAVLRDQRLDLIQRELLLDTMVQNTPVAMLLVADRGSIVFANLAARQLLNQGRRLEGHDLADLLDHLSASLVEALARGGDGLFTVRPQAAADDEEYEEETYHLARRQFTLNGRRHELLLLRQLTAELRRQEVQTWKKVIRVISHELNNSLAPVGSLAHSGQELLRRGQTERLPDVLATIGERTRHLEHFISGYARFAKLPMPRRERVYWQDFVAGLSAQLDFRVAGKLPGEPAFIDPAQMEQAVVNLIKNAQESGSAPSAVELAVRRIAGGTVIDVLDRGAGMSDAVMANALVPFYSTKRSGTGLGLALAREIIEAHGGRITLNNREGGGLGVGLVLPD